jgi:sterol-4alpha-carboxylate 3-dehydrogenase (decarboxylating)
MFLPFVLPPTPPKFASFDLYPIMQLIAPQAEAESLVLAANRSPTAPNFLTCALRPSGIFGPGDVQLLPPMIKVYQNGQTGFQLGANENLFDFTYVGNVAHAHLLAARALIYTSTLSTSPLDHERVDGEAFFITNDSPVYFWDFARAVWKAAGSKKGTEHVWVIGKETGLKIGYALEWVMWAVRRQSKLTRREVKYSSMTRYYDISKAKKRLGYAPIVSLGEGIEIGVKWFQEERMKGLEMKAQ